MRAIIEVMKPAPTVYVDPQWNRRLARQYSALVLFFWGSGAVGLGGTGPVTTLRLVLLVPLTIGMVVGLVVVRRRYRNLLVRVEQDSVFVQNAFSKTRLRLSQVQGGEVDPYRAAAVTYTLLTTFRPDGSPVSTRLLAVPPAEADAFMAALRNAAE